MRSRYEISFIRRKYPSSSDTEKKRKRESETVKELDLQPLRYLIDRTERQFR